MNGNMLRKFEIGTGNKNCDSSRAAYIRSYSYLVFSVHLRVFKIDFNTITEGLLGNQLIPVTYY